MKVYKVRLYPRRWALRVCPHEQAHRWTKLSGRTWSHVSFVKKSVSYLFSTVAAQAIFEMTPAEAQDPWACYITIEEYDLDNMYLSRVLYKIPYNRVFNLPKKQVESAFGTITGFDFDLEQFRIGE